LLFISLTVTALYKNIISAEFAVVAGSVLLLCSLIIWILLHHHKHTHHGHHKLGIKVLLILVLFSFIIFYENSVVDHVLSSLIFVGTTGSLISHVFMTLHKAKDKIHYHGHVSLYMVIYAALALLVMNFPSVLHPLLPLLVFSVVYYYIVLKLLEHSIKKKTLSKHMHKQLDWLSFIIVCSGALIFFSITHLISSLGLLRILVLL
jgi:hypothetical protein